ncbi:hypothetical protein DEAC_c20090 [Desulfosporosinus acididurans]|uniref:Uncharacterized protein n=1 Tax=Desulfosporosinus acididurans TaxID=476652 RepID=A0A0J1FR53_9FIRM|nr:hypothetical protein DEAC_c20090 [Desulfosporosinus acididurans]
MSKFNSRVPMKTVNISGHEAYGMADKEKLVIQVLTSLFNEDKYYGDNSREIVKTAQKLITASSM